MNDIEYILDFTVNLGERMLETGANLERVNDTMNRICLSYRLKNISIFSLNRTIMVSAKDANGTFATRHVSVAPISIHLAKLNQLNQLSRKVCSEKPDPAILASLLHNAEIVHDYFILTTILGYMIAMSGLCIIFGGNKHDILAVNIITIALFFVIRLLSKPNLNHFVVNTLCTWFAGSLAIFLVKLGIGYNYSIIIIVTSLMMIPGIPLVNAVRNILCGNEINGIFEFLKVILETLAIVLGLFISSYMFGGLMGW